MSQKAEEQAVVQYLGKKPYYGDSAFENKEQVKACMSARTFRFDKRLKLWGTVSLWEVSQLIKSGLWWPRGIDRGWGGVFKRQLHLALESESREWSAKAEEESSRAREKSVLPQTGPSKEEREQAEKERSREVLENTQEEVSFLKEVGLHTETIVASEAWEDTPCGHLGPRAGISSAGRIIRFVKFGHTRIRITHPLDADLTDLYTESDKEIAKKLNSLVGGFTENRKKQEAATTSCFFFSSPVSGNKRAVRAVSDQYEAVHKVVSTGPWTNPPKLAKGTCRMCWKSLDPQFLECKCRGGWIICRKCPAGSQILHPLVQPCSHVSQHVKVE